MLKINLGFNSNLTVNSENSKKMANLQGAPKLITQMAIVCTEKQFETMRKDDPTLLNKEYVFLDSTQVRNELRGGVTTGALPKGGIALIPQDCQAGYLAFLLNSMPIQYLLYGGMYNSKNKVKINKKLVSKLKLFDVADESQNAYALANSLRSAAFIAYENNKEDDSFHRLYYLVSDLCNMLALELYAHPMFEEKGIYILDSWEESIKKSLDKDDNGLLLESLTKSDQRLRNELMKAHVLIDDMTKYLKSKTDGVEDK